MKVLDELMAVDIMVARLAMGSKEAIEILNDALVADTVTKEKLDTEEPTPENDAKLHEVDAVKKLLMILDEHLIRGKRISVVFKEYCNSNAKTFEKVILTNPAALTAYVLEREGVIGKTARMQGIISDITAKMNLPKDAIKIAYSIADEGFVVSTSINLQLHTKLDIPLVAIKFDGELEEQLNKEIINLATRLRENIEGFASSIRIPELPA